MVALVGQLEISGFLLHEDTLIAKDCINLKSALFEFPIVCVNGGYMTYVHKLLLKDNIALTRVLALAHLLSFELIK